MADIRRRLPQIRVHYCVIILVLPLILLSLVIWRYYASHHVAETVDTAVQAVAATAAAAAAVIALGLADPPKREVSIEQEGTAYLQTDKREPECGHPVEYKREEIPEPHHVPFKHYPERFHSHRVGFLLVNTSGFTLKRPRVTITAPADRRHPAEPKEQRWEPTCSALFGVTRGLPWAVHTEDKLMVTADLADEWGRGTKRPFWMRLVLDNVPGEPFALEVTVTCDDAEGTTLKVPIPDDLVKPQPAMQP